jgi:hypothetical protein
MIWQQRLIRPKGKVLVQLQIKAWETGKRNPSWERGREIKTAEAADCALMNVSSASSKRDLEIT